MDLKEIVDALLHLGEILTSWPVIILFIVLYFRDKIKTLFDGLWKAKFGRGTFEFELKKERSENFLNELRSKVKQIIPATLSKKLKEDSMEKLEMLNNILELLEVLGVELDSEDYTNRGKYLFYTGKYKMALEAFEKVIKLDSNNSKAWFNKGLTLGNLNRNVQAIKSFEKAIKLNEEFALAWAKKGLFLNRIEKEDEALEAIKKAIKIGPKSAEVWDSKGVLCYFLNNVNEAIKAVDKAIEIDPNLDGAWYNRAFYYSLQEDKENFIFSLEKAIKLNPIHIETAKKDEGFEKYLDDEDFRKLVEQKED